MNKNKPVYAIGDLQGCLDSLVGLLEQIPGDAPLVIMGDLVNRGPQSLETLRRVKQLEESGRAKCLLGNHDLHRLACAAGHGTVHGKDTIGPILEAPDRDGLIDWLRRQKIAIYEDGALFVHAGVNPAWTLEDALRLAGEAEAGLSGKGWRDYIDNMYGGEQWDPSLPGSARMRAIFNSFTRIRFVKPDGTLDFDTREGLKQAPAGLVPWFERRDRKLFGQLIVIGHWSMLGLMLRPNLIAIDAGCLWGGERTAIRMSDRRILTERCPLWCEPGRKKRQQEPRAGSQAA